MSGDALDALGAATGWGTLLRRDVEAALPEHRAALLRAYVEGAREIAAEERRIAAPLRAEVERREARAEAIECALRKVLGE